MFSVSAKTQYAIRAMSYLALRDDRTATACDIAAAESIPPKYLEGILTRLKDSGLVESLRGKNGGYRMALDPSDIPMLRIVEAMEGCVKPVTCVDALGACAQDVSCHSRRFWIGLKEAIVEYLSTKTLKDVSEG